MKIDLFHNKIVADTLTPDFERSVRENLIPLLSELYSEGEILGIQMYEDYIADGFAFNRCWYYPLTVITRSGYDTVWIKWALTESDFVGGLPYSYIGSGNIEFRLASDTPDRFAQALEGRALYCEEGLIKIIVKSGSDSAKLSGKYSQTFLDELARQITPAIESAASVEGIADSPIELVLSFAPATYMEHISENVTYRRFTMIDGASAPRDFWVKWTRLDGAVAYPMSEHVWGDNILFELGEDVSHKVLEKEYRYLLASTGDKYHSAMSRSGVTSWRDLIKRAVKYGRLKKIDQEIELSPETLALGEQLAAALGRAGISTPTPEPEIAEVRENDDFALAMMKMREVAEGTADEYEAAPEPLWEEIPEEPEEKEEISDEVEDILDEIFESDEIEPEDEPIEEYDEEKAALDELTRLALEALAMAKEAPAEEDAKEDEPSGEMMFDILQVPEEEAEEIAEEPVEENVVEEVPEEEAVAEPIEIEEEIPAVPYVNEDSIRAEIEAKIRLEYENRARIKAEEELAALRREQERLRIENEAILAKAEREKEELRFEYEKLREQARREALAKEARDAVRRAEEEKLRAKIETQLRHEARERERLAEAARMAIEEQRRLEAEAARAARLREEEERTRMENERRAAEEARLVEMRQAEEARLEQMRQAELERVRREEEERQRALRETMPEMGDGRYNYTTRNVRLIFRKSVDPNITARIHEILKASIEYYGKEKIYLKIRATVPDSQTVCLEFIHIPLEEMELLGNLIKILGNSGLGIAKAIIE